CPFTADGAGRHDSKAHGFAMKKIPVIAGALVCVTDGVTKIENRAFASTIALGTRDDCRFNRDVAFDEWRKFGTYALIGAQLGVLRHCFEHFAVGDNSVLDDLGEALIELAPGQRL